MNNEYMKKIYPISKELKLNLGCGDDIKKDFVNIDMKKLPGVDLVWNLDKLPLPFKDSSVDYILCSHSLEHLNNPVGFMIDLHRICKSGATIDISVPHYSSCASYAELDHKRPGLSYHTFGTRGFNQILDGMFKVTKRELNFTRMNQTWTNNIFNPIINLSPAIYERFFSFILPCSEVKFILKVIKN